MCIYFRACVHCSNVHEILCATVHVQMNVSVRLCVRTYVQVGMQS